MSGGATAVPAVPECGSLARLTQLQRLYIAGGQDSPTLPDGLVASLVQLQQLTSLEWWGSRIAPASLQHLPAQLAVLKIKVVNTAAAEVNLHHMTSLQNLTLSAVGGKSQLQARLPTSLTALSVTAAGAWQIMNDSLPSVRELLVAPKDMSTLVDPSQRFPNLKSLSVSCCHMAAHGQLSAAQADAVAAAVGAATHITCLQLHRVANKVHSIQAPRAADSCIMLAASLGQLRQLGSLTVIGFNVQPTDMLKLTVLSSLVSLSVWKCPDFGDTAAAVLAGKQTGLKALQLVGCGLQNPVLLPALAGCTGLQVLNLEHNVLPICAETLLSLTALRQLTQLRLPAAASTVSGDCMQQFKAGMPQLQILSVL
jgi:hypothetical protein